MTEGGGGLKRGGIIEVTPFLNDPYGILTSRDKKVWGRFKVINWGGNASHKRGTLFKGRDSHHVILLYCETLLSYWVL